MTTDPTLESLADWVSSPTTEWFFTLAQREWGPSGMKYQQAVRDASKDANAVVELQKVLHAQEAILSLLLRPKEILEAMKAQKRAALMPSTSRRGPGL